MAERTPVDRIHIARVSAAAIELVRTAAVLIEPTAGPAERDWFLGQLSEQLASVIAAAAEHGPAEARRTLSQEEAD